MDKDMVWGLRVLELRLAEVDWHRLSSIPDTSDYFTSTFLHTSSRNASTITHRQALKLPTSILSSKSGTFISPGWEDLPRSLSALGQEEKQAFLKVMLTELDCKFVLQLDPCPIWTYLVSMPLTTRTRAAIVLARSSHSVRLIDHLESANLRGTHRLHGFQASESHKVAETATDLAEKVSDMDPSCSLVLIQLLRV